MSQSPVFANMWTDGMYGQFVEELIAASFGDFAPYAGADVQRVSVIRQIGDEAQAAVQFEENGDFSVMATHRQAGTMGFSSSDVIGASAQRADVNLCVPLITGGSLASSSTATAPASASPSSAVDARTHEQIVRAQALASPQVRFTDHARGAQLVQGVQRFLGLGRGAAPYRSVGQLEVSGSLLPTVWTSARQAYALRGGPLAARLTVLPYPAQLRAPAQEASSSSLMDETSQSALRRAKRPSYHYTMEATACVPLTWPTDSTAPTTSTTTAQHPPIACTVAVQHPLLMGDSLVGLAVQSDRLESVARRAGIPSELDPADATRRLLRFPSAPATARAGALEAITYEEAQTSFRALLVQTVASKSLEVSESATMGTNASTLGADGLYYTIERYDGAWTSLPTLVGVSASFYRNLVRVSVAGIFHEGTADVEAAVVLDATPRMPTTPTLVKVGWNNLGRVAVGITSLFYDALSVTLGVHAMPGDGVRFGVEIAF